MIITSEIMTHLKMEQKILHLLNGKFIHTFTYFVHKPFFVRYFERVSNFSSVDTKTSLTRAKLAVSLIMDSLAKMDLFSS